MNAKRDAAEQWRTAIDVVQAFPDAGGVRQFSRGRSRSRWAASWYGQVKPRRTPDAPVDTLRERTRPAAGCVGAWSGSERGRIVLRFMAQPHACSQYRKKSDGRSFPGMTFPDMTFCRRSLGAGRAAYTRPAGLRTGDWSALKVSRLGPDGAEESASVRREAAILRNLDHPGIVAFFEAGEKNGPRVFLNGMACGPATGRAAARRTAPTARRDPHGGEIERRDPLLALPPIHLWGIEAVQHRIQWPGRGQVGGL